MNIIIMIIITAFAGIGLGYAIATYLNRVIGKTKIKQSEQKVQEILESAKKQADYIKKEAALHARNNLLELRAEFEKETKERRQELVSLEKRLLQ
ncbi:MAG: Rnase Y domain-containing protein, partial [bacterium]